MKRVPFSLLLASVFLVLAGQVQGQSTTGGVLTEQRSQEHSFRVRELFGGLANPWALAFLPDGELLVSERPGKLRLLSPDSTGRYQSRILGGLPPVDVRGQGGLLDLALDPAFGSNRLIYFTYAKAGPGGAGTALARARLDKTGLQDLVVLYELKGKTSSSVHFGSRMAFGPDGLLYFNISDRGAMNRAQDSRDAAGSVLRLNPDGSMPPANPVVEKKDWLPELFTMGHRNIQGLVFDGSGQLWATEHGPRGGDELNLIEAGKNYGWPLVTLGINYDGSTISTEKSRPGLTDPVYSWTPSPAPSGLAWYPPGGPFKAWAGNLLSGNLAGQELRRLVLDGKKIVREEVLLKGVLGRLRDVRVGPDGYVYLLTDANPGKLLRLEPLD